MSSPDQLPWIRSARTSDKHGCGIARACFLSFDQLTYNDTGNQMTGLTRLGPLHRRFLTCRYSLVLRFIALDDQRPYLRRMSEAGRNAFYGLKAACLTLRPLLEQAIAPTIH